MKVHLEGPHVERVELTLTESPRLFESLLVGKSFREVPEIICRICALCSTIHKIAALEAVEKALGVRVSEVTRLTRELINCGATIQDHALHLYCLVLPDMLQLRGVAELALQSPDLLKSGLAIKKVGNLIQETVGGRLIHPVNISLGGLGRRMDKETLLRLKEELLAILPACRETVRLFLTCFDFPALPAPNYLAVHPAQTLSGELIKMGNGRFFPVDAYRQNITESVVQTSHAKMAQVLGEVPTVGSLSRLNLGVPLGPETTRLMEMARGAVIGNDIRGNSAAQAIELFQAAELGLQLIDQLLAIGADGPGNVPVRAQGGRGTAACEAPRGILIHSYCFDESGTCTDADVITPTSLNQAALLRDLLALARGLQGADAAVMGSAMERLVRCYDPCISCSVHLVQIQGGRSLS